MKESQLESVAEAVSDGERVDWGTVRRRFAGEVPDDYLTNLEALSRLAEPGGGTGKVQEPVRDRLWVRILLAFAVVQIVLGIAGHLAYRPDSWVNVLRLLTIVTFAGVGLVLWRNRTNVRARYLGAVFLLYAFGFSRNPFGLLVEAWLPPSSIATLLAEGLAVDAWAAYFVWRFVQRLPERQQPVRRPPRRWKCAPHLGSRWPPAARGRSAVPLDAAHGPRGEARPVPAQGRAGILDRRCRWPAGGAVAT